MSEEHSKIAATATLDAATTERTMLLAEVYRRNGVWWVRAMGQGYDDGLAELAFRHAVAVEDRAGHRPADVTGPTTKRSATDWFRTPETPPTQKGTRPESGHLQDTCAAARRVVRSDVRMTRGRLLGAR
ncbi:TerD family protein [Pseudonocardia sp. N23]|uniref:TerD family protein n=1 Tax=Pseudonocardia sp. N23 TaxID=1987376 RepID=UPI00209C0EB9|nr:TerD family protein [Pseudonocardia sp. N23]